jgi:hypothetical protein
VIWAQSGMPRPARVVLVAVTMVVSSVPVIAFVRTHRHRDERDRLGNTEPGAESSPHRPAVAVDRRRRLREAILSLMLPVFMHVSVTIWPGSAVLERIGPNTLRKMGALCHGAEPVRVKSGKPCVSNVPWSCKR